MRWRALAAAAAAICIMAVGFALSRFGPPWVLGRPSGYQAVGPQAAESSHADAFAFTFRDPPRALPVLRFEDGAGHRQSLANFRGRPVILNIWATWCSPCRREMPALDRLQAELGKTGLVVLPLSIDRKGASVVRQFYRDLGLVALGVYVDPSGEAAGAVGAMGLPTTLLIDRDGREVGRKIGPAEWDSPQIAALVGNHLRVASEERRVVP
jgi:thiol-disulfide isomerase/thioredoxin